MAMNKTITSRKAVYAFLYTKRVESPKTYYSREDLLLIAEAERLEATLSFGLEMGHLELYQEKHYRLTAMGMLFAEQSGWVEENNGY